MLYGPNMPFTISSQKFMNLKTDVGDSQWFPLEAVEQPVPLWLTNSMILRSNAVLKQWHFDLVITSVTKDEAELVHHFYGFVVFSNEDRLSVVKGEYTFGLRLAFSLQVHSGVARYTLPLCTVPGEGDHHLPQKCMAPKQKKNFL